MSVLRQFAPLVSIVVFLAVGFGWRAWLQKRRFGKSGVILFRNSSRRQMVRDAAFVLILIASFAQAAAAAIAPQRMAGTGLLSESLVWAATVKGLCLVIVGTGGMVVAQRNLGQSWRIGIDEGARPGLITTGFYRYSRNPIFVGMFLTLIGLTLLLPTLLSVVMLAGAAACVRSQVIEEERYLRTAYGPDYEAYAHRVGRFLPGLGRL